jgi:D-alanyl-D-alanine carboxypeptidase
MARKMSKLFQETLDSQQAIEHAMQTDQRQELMVPGLSAAVILPDGSTWLGVSGKSSDREGMSSAMLFGLASVTKTYIAALVVQLAEEGVLSVDDPISNWIPELGNIDGNITVRQLLNHTSGLNPYQRTPEYLAAINSQPGRVWTAQEILEEFQGEPVCEPGSCFEESLMDYVLLGMIVEKATGSSVSSQLTERFFDPLELEHTFLYPDQMYASELMAHMWWDVTGSGQPVDVVEGAENPPLIGLFSSMWTGGAMHATAEDLAWFVRGLFEGEVIDADALDEMLAIGPELDPDVYYGYSVIIEEVDGQTVYWHPGGAGFSSIYLYYSEDGLTITVLGNLMVDLKSAALALHQTYVENQR